MGNGNGKQENHHEDISGYDVGDEDISGYNGGDESSVNGYGVKTEKKPKKKQRKKLKGKSTASEKKNSKITGQHSASEKNNGTILQEYKIRQTEEEKKQINELKKQIKEKEENLKNFVSKLLYDISNGFNNKGELIKIINEIITGLDHGIIGAIVENVSAGENPIENLTELGNKLDQLMRSDDEDCKNIGFALQPNKNSQVKKTLCFLKQIVIFFKNNSSVGKSNYGWYEDRLLGEINRILETIKKEESTEIKKGTVLANCPLESNSEGLRQIQAQVNEAVEIMRKNAESVLERNETLHELCERASNLQASAGQLKHTAGRVKRRQRKNSISTDVALGLLALGVIFGTVAAALWIEYQSTKNKNVHISAIIFNVATFLAFTSSIFFLCLSPCSNVEELSVCGFSSHYKLS
ncbi:MAG: hypothetical protein HRK26_00915 [Rickettsiaceae bacterium H1]|nr:hypothetical protein [Rickettsiaceae bacterium H1]